MTLEEIRNRCYKLIDTADEYIAKVQQIRNYQQKTICTTLLSALKKFRADTVYPFLNQIGNQMNSGMPVDNAYVEETLQGFEKKIADFYQSLLFVQQNAATWW